MVVAYGLKKLPEDDKRDEDGWKQQIFVDFVNESDEA